MTVATEHSVRSLPPLTVAVTPTGPGAVRIVVAGELDVRSVGSLAEPILEALDRRHPATIELDLAGVTFVDGAAAARLRRLHRQAAECGCELSISAAQQGTWWTFNAAGLASIFPATGGHRFQSEPGS
jgi:anti-anti-sigma factor